VTLGQVSIDGVLALSGPARNGAGGTTNTGVLAGDDLLSKVGLTYKF
jgi:hypothetical protein